MSESGFSGQIVVVTGASAGIGAAIAKNLASKGALLVLNARDPEKLSVIEKALSAITNCCVYAGDITHQKQAKELAAFAVERFGRIDALINNVGGGSIRCNIEDITDEQWILDLDKNLTSAFTVCREVVPLMKQNRFGRIVNVSSVAGRTYSYLAGHGYSTAKAGLQGFTRHLAWELGEFNVTVNAVAPGITLTERIVKKWESLSEQERQTRIEKIALKRMASPDEIAHAATFLASTEASYITGVTLDVNGGLFMS